MKNTREILFLGALLHDIGKFYQRADMLFSDKYNQLSDFSKNIANDICPVNENGRFGYQHVVWTNEFFEGEPFKSVFKKLEDLNVNLYDKDEVNPDGLINLATNHHKPKTIMQAIVTMADWWSAGIDRREANELENGKYKGENIDWGKSRYKQIPLYSVFNQINNGNYKYAFPLKPLCLDKDAIFPKEIKEKNDGLSQESYNKLWQEFKEEFQRLPTNSLNGFIESLLFLLKKHTWCIPSNTMDMANVSLFDHLKTTAAFADCIYEYYDNHPDDFNWNNSDYRLTIKEGKHPVILVGGDVSGIQKFIYNIASRKAAVSLKGRSFYLQLLIDSVIQRIISHEDINANLGHIVYSSGGRFYMLLPNTDKVKNAIEELKNNFENELWENHYGKLVLNIDFVPFSFNHANKNIDYEDCKGKQLGDLWKHLADKLTAQKNTKFKSLLINKFSDFFEPINCSGAKVKVCAVTGIESDVLEKIDDNQNSDDPAYVLPIVKEQALLGNKLKDADYILTFKSGWSSDYLNRKSKFNIEILDINNYLFDKIDLTKEDADFRTITSADTTRVKMINEMNFLAPQIKGQGISYGFQFYGGNEQAKNSNGELKTFEELAGGSYFGVLRMDVDGLGEIFINGLSQTHKSFSAYSTLSFMLDLFFSGYLNKIREKYADTVNILYSGGDDVFAVGKWDSIINFAEDVRKEFAKFIGRDDISISAGIAIVGEKFPIAKAAQLAEIAEKNAKNFSNGKKNAICLFGETISWKDEFDFVKSLKDEFLDLIKNHQMPKAILHKVMLFNEMQKRKDVKYIWHTAYYLKRFSDGKKDEVKKFCSKLQIQFVNNKRNYDLIALAARWTEYEIKEN